MESTQRLVLDALCSLIEAAVNDPDLKAALGIPPAIRFRVTAADAPPGSLPARVTAEGGRVQHGRLV